MGFFVEPETSWYEFDGEFAGWKVLLKKEMDAGDQEELENVMLSATADGKDGKELKPIFKPGGLKLLELNIIKIVSPDGKELEPTLATIKKLNRQIRFKLIDEINRMNAIPFVKAGM